MSVTRLYKIELPGLFEVPDSAPLGSLPAAGCATGSLTQSEPSTLDMADAGGDVGDDVQVVGLLVHRAFRL